jgi:hypothetical protein
MLRRMRRELDFGVCRLGVCGTTNCERGPRLKPTFLARRFSAGLKSGFPLLKTGGSHRVQTGNMSDGLDRAHS